MQPDERSVSSYGIRFLSAIPKLPDRTRDLLDDLEVDPWSWKVDWLNPECLTATQEKVEVKLVESLCSSDQSTWPPIIVLRIGIDLLVIEGHHRLTAATILSVPLACCVVDLEYESR